MVRLASAWQNARHAPTDSVVALNYERFIGETLLQFQLLESEGTRFEPTDDITPYDRLEDLVRDLDKRRTVQIWIGGAIPSDHPLAQRGRVPGHADWRILDALRGVHEVFGHAIGNSFRTADGEEAAFRSHLATYSIASWPTLTDEFRAPLAWLLHGPHLMERDETLAWDRLPYPPQKAVALPVELWSCPSDSGK